MSSLDRFRSPRSRAARHRAAVACGALVSLLVCGSAAGQFGPSIEVPPGPTVMPAVPLGGYPPTVAPTAVGTYYTPPAWNQTLAPNLRFVILSNFNSDAVLDRETGLIWTRRYLGEWPGAIECGGVAVGGRGGWRLPTVIELQSLIDASLTATGVPRLPVGHPFVFSNITAYYWSSEYTGPTGRWAVNLSSGGTTSFALGDFQSPNTWQGVLCVRGG